MIYFLPADNTPAQKVRQASWYQAETCAAIRHVCGCFFMFMVYILLGGTDLSVD
jgi:hypothetical protein